MNAPIIVAKRATSSFSSSICISCRKTLLRQLSSSSRRAFPEFQSYRLNPHSLSPPRSTGGPETSITYPIEPLMPRVYETRSPPSQAPRSQDPVPQQSVREGEVPRPQADYASRAPQAVLSSFSNTEPAQTASAADTVQTPTVAPAAAAAAAATAAPKPRPRSKLRTPRKAAMKLTPTAVEQLRALLDQPEPKLIKVGVRNRGCSGLAYHLEYVDKPGAFDETVEQDGVKVLIDSKALFSIIGSEMDWVEDKLNERFVFRNPNIKEQCGCGESFMV